MRSTPLAYSKGGTRCTAARIPEERCDGFASGALVLDEAALHEWLGRVGSSFVPLRSHATRWHSSGGDRRQCSDEQRTRFDLTVTTSERPQWLRLQGTLAASAAAQGEGDLQLSGTQPWAVSGMDKDSHCNARSSRTLLRSRPWKLAACRNYAVGHSSAVRLGAPAHVHLQCRWDLLGLGALILRKQF